MNDSDLLQTKIYDGKLSKYLCSIVIFTVLTVAGCGGGGDDDPKQPSTNSAPISDAGVDQSITLGTTVDLNGTGSSDPNGDTISFQWTITGQPTGSAASFDDAQSSSPTFNYDTIGTYTIMLTVSDGQLSNQNSLTVTVTGTVVNNTPPTSDAGADQTAFLGTTVNLDGSNSSDLDGNFITYQWSIDSQPAGSSPSFDDPQIATPILVTDTAGTYELRLLVSDGTDSHEDTVTVTINPLPVINSFSAAPSNADSKTPVVFTWNISGADSSSLTCTLDIDDDGGEDYSISDCNVSGTQAHIYSTAGNYSAFLNISDINGLLVQQSVLVTINNPPVINAFTLSPNPAYLNSSATFEWDASDIDGDELTCLLDINNDGVNEYTINDCANTNTQTHTFSIAGDYTALLTVEDGFTNPVTQTLELTVIQPLSKDVSVSGPAVAGEWLMYTITVGNTTLVPIDDVNISLVVPEQLSFVAANDTDPNSSGCGNTICSPTEEANWDLGTLSAGESRTISVNTLVDAGTLNDVNIVLPVTFSATNVNAEVINQSVVVFNSPTADLVLSASSDPVVQNETFTYLLDFGNTSAATLTNTELKAFLPAGVTISAISDGGVEVSTGEVVWDESSVAVSASLHREITVIADSVTAGQILTASAQLTHDGGQAIDNTTEYAITVVENALPLEIDISTSANPVVSEERLLYTITVSNTSALPVDNVDVQLRVPAELGFVPVNDTEPNSSGCGNTICSPTEEANWDLGTLAAGESRTLVINALVDAILSGNLISMPVRVTATDLGDTISLLKTVAVYNTPSAELALSASSDPVVQNETFIYQFDFSNTSGNALSNSVLRAVLPPQVSVSNISDTGVEVSTGEVEWTISSLASGAALHREIEVIADGTTVGNTLKLRAQLTHNGGLEVDNRSEFAVSVAKDVGIAALMSVDITSTPNPVASNGVIDYTITITNGFGLPVDDVNVQLRVPDELSFVPVTDTTPNSSGCGNTICTATEEANWSLGTLAAGESQIITINAKVGSGFTNGTLIMATMRVTAADMEDTINLQHTTVIDN